MAPALHHHCRPHCLSTTAAFILLCFTSVSAMLASPTLQLGIELAEMKRANEVELAGSRRRLMGGPGSAPPTCRFKCGWCLPCKPVHVPIQPGVSIPLEYYPEAWRCKCRNKLFVP